METSNANFIEKYEPGKQASVGLMNDLVLEGDLLEDNCLGGSRIEAPFMDGILVINNCDLRVEPNGKSKRLIRCPKD